MPSDAPYTAEKWPQAEKNKVAMITRMDADIGMILAQWKMLGLEDNTLILFTSDNGPHREGGNDPAFFNSSGPHRGIKRSLTDGGIRVPAIARWPGVIKRSTTSDHVLAFWDFLPTACDLVSAAAPKGVDGLSLLPTVTRSGSKATHDILYWEFQEGGSVQAVRHANWKAIRPLNKPLELYDVTTDLVEKANVAAANPTVVKTIDTNLKSARMESKEFPLRESMKKKTSAHNWRDNLSQ